MGFYCDFYILVCLRSFVFDHCIKFLNFQLFSGHLFVVMEYCANDSLKNFLSKHSAGFLNEIEEITDSVNVGGFSSPSGDAESAYLLPVHSRLTDTPIPMCKYKVMLW